MNVRTDHLKVCRVLSEDDKTLTVEIGKSDDHKFTLAQGIDPESAPDRFYTILFVHKAGAGMEIWVPWEDD